MDKALSSNSKNLHIQIQLNMKCQQTSKNRVFSNGTPLQWPPISCAEHFQMLFSFINRSIHSSVSQIDQFLC